jgi:hypothetical protein
LKIPEFEDTAVAVLQMKQGEVTEFDDQSGKFFGIPVSCPENWVDIAGESGCSSDAFDLICHDLIQIDSEPRKSKDSPELNRLSAPLGYDRVFVGNPCEWFLIAVCSKPRRRRFRRRSILTVVDPEWIFGHSGLSADESF